MATGDTWKKWADENVVRVYVNLNRTNDADILEALENAKNSGEGKGTALKRWARIGIEADSKK